jgi:hypothetical protein
VPFVGDRADLLTEPPEARVRELLDVVAHVVARLDPFALPEAVADRSDGQRVPALPTAGS